MTPGAAVEMLTSVGACRMTSQELSTCLGAGAGAWDRFAAHWDELVPDGYAAALGTRRLRR